MHLLDPLGICKRDESMHHKNSHDPKEAEFASHDGCQVRCEQMDCLRGKSGKSYKSCFQRLFIYRVS